MNLSYCGEYQNMGFLSQRSIGIFTSLIVRLQNEDDLNFDFKR